MLPRMRAMRSCLLAFAGSDTEAFERISLRSTTLRVLSFASVMMGGERKRNKQFGMKSTW